MKKHKRYLNGRDKQILAFITRYRVGTNELLREHCFDDDTGLRNVDRVLRRLEERKLIRRTELDEGKSYYTMTRRGLGLNAENPRTPKLPTEQTLPVYLAIATYCVEHRLKRLTKEKFVEDYPELTRPGKGNGNYTLVEDDGVIKLELLVVDRGGAAHRIRTRVRRLVAQRKGMPHFVALMQAGKFRITVLTATPEQQWKILRRIGNSFDPIEVTAVVIPALRDLLMLRKK